MFGVKQKITFPFLWCRRAYIPATIHRTFEGDLSTGKAYWSLATVLLNLISLNLDSIKNERSAFAIIGGISLWATFQPFRLTFGILSLVGLTGQCYDILTKG